MGNSLHERLKLDQIAGGMTVAAMLSGIAVKAEPDPAPGKSGKYEVEVFREKMKAIPGNH